MASTAHTAINEPTQLRTNPTGVSPRRTPPRPELFDLPSRYEIQRLMMLLRDEDLEINGFVAELRRSPGLQQYIRAAANARLASDEHYVTDPAHALMLLGMNPTHELLRALVFEPARKAA